MCGSLASAGGNRCANPKARQEAPICSIYQVTATRIRTRSRRIRAPLLSCKASPSLRSLPPQLDIRYPIPSLSRSTLTQSRLINVSNLRTDKLASFHLWNPSLDSSRKEVLSRWLTTHPSTWCSVTAIIPASVVSGSSMKHDVSFRRPGFSRYCCTGQLS